MSQASARQKQCLEFQDKMARRREKDFQHQQKWGEQVRYYKKWEKSNAKFDDWTSPRYYESNNELIERTKTTREKAKTLDERREKLRKLFAEEEATYEIEMMVANAKEEAKKRENFDDIPTELLKDVNVSLKLDEDAKRRHEAEIKLYHNWRQSNPMIRHAESTKRGKDLKLSWLDQQIERRMAKEKEEEECKRILKERDKNIAEQQRKEEMLSDEIKKKNEGLCDDLMKQMEEINLKQKLTEELQEEEKEEFEKQRKLSELEEKLKLEECRRRNKEYALHNMKQHKVKLQRMAKEIEENINQETEFIEQLKNSRIAERIKNKNVKEEIQKTIDEFLEFSQEQKRLEKSRQNYLDFVFDSEAKITYDKQTELWKREEVARQSLIKDVLKTIDEQIKDNITKNKNKQRELIEDREKMLIEVERYEKEIDENKRLESEKKKLYKKELDEQIADKRMRERKLKEFGKRKIDVELENVRKEEDRLKKEIIKIQNSHAPLRYARKKPWH